MMWELVLFLVADGDNPRPRPVMESGVICEVALRCAPVRFESRLACVDFLIEHGRDWRRATGDDVVAVCKEADGEAIS